MKIRAIAIDLDGTLLSDDKTMSEANRTMIQAMSGDYSIILSTARGMGSVQPYIHQLGLHGDKQYTVAYNGGYVINGRGEVIDHHPIDPRVGFDFISWLSQNTATLQINAYPCDRICPIEEIDDLNRFLRDVPIYKIGAIGEKKEVDRVRALITKSFNDALAITSDKVSIECVSKGLSKAQGLKLVLERLGLSVDQLAAMGDAENDIEMLAMAGFGIAMANADEALFPYADFISDDNNHDGVAKALRRILTYQKKAGHE